jgi:hypothetical protein
LEHRLQAATDGTEVEKREIETQLAKMRSSIADTLARIDQIQDDGAEVT